MITRHRNGAYLSILILIAILLWLPRLQGPLDFRWDASVYYVLGISLEEGKGYRLLNEPGEIQAIQYPPLLPLMAAAYQRLAGTTDPAVVGYWFRLTYFVLFIAYIVTVYRLSCLRLSPDFSFFVALITLLHMGTIFLSDLFFAELPYALTTLMFFFVLAQGNGVRSYWGAGLLGIVSYLLRSSGVALLAAWIGESLFKRRFREMACRVMLALIPVIAWQTYILHVQNSPEYTHPNYEYQRAAYQNHNVGYLENLAYIDSSAPELGKVSSELLVSRVLNNLVDVPLSLGIGVSGGPWLVMTKLRSINEGLETVRIPPGIAKVPIVFLGVMVLWGLALLLMRGDLILPLYVAGSVGLMCLTPWPNQFERYLTPCIPLLTLALFVALIEARKRLSDVARGKWQFTGMAFITIVVFGVFMIQAVPLYKIYQTSQRVFYEDKLGQQKAYQLFWYSSSWKYHDEALNWLKKIAKPGETVATTTPQYTYLKTGMSAIMPPFEPDVGEAQRLIDSVPVNYLVVDSLDFLDVTRRYSLPMVKAFPLQWEMIYSTGDGTSRIYRRVFEEGRSASHNKSEIGQS